MKAKQSDEKSKSVNDNAFSPTFISQNKPKKSKSAQNSFFEDDFWNDCIDDVNEDNLDISQHSK
jgi:hypothetical protein